MPAVCDNRRSAQRNAVVGRGGGLRNSAGEIERGVDCLPRGVVEDEFAGDVERGNRVAREGHRTLVGERSRDVENRGGAHVYIAVPLDIRAAVDIEIRAVCFCGGDAVDAEFGKSRRGYNGVDIVKFKGRVLPAVGGQSDIRKIDVRRCRAASVLYRGGVEVLRPAAGACKRVNRFLVGVDVDGQAAIRLPIDGVGKAGVSVYDVDRMRGDVGGGVQIAARGVEGDVGRGCRAADCRARLPAVECLAVGVRAEHQRREQSYG